MHRKGSDYTPRTGCRDLHTDLDCKGYYNQADDHGRPSSLPLPYPHLLQHRSLRNAGHGLDCEVGSHHVAVVGSLLSVDLRGLAAGTLLVGIHLSRDILLETLHDLHVRTLVVVDLFSVVAVGLVEVLRRSIADLRVADRILVPRCLWERLGLLDHRRRCDSGSRALRYQFLAVDDFRWFGFLKAWYCSSSLTGLCQG